MTGHAIELPKDLREILVITYGGIGDVLLTTPLIGALKQAFPAARLDVYVQKGRAGMLAGNPDIRRVYEAHDRHGAFSYIRFFLEHTGRYGLAVSTRTSDRQVLFARAAGRKAVSLVPEQGENQWWKKRLLTGSARQDFTLPTVCDMLQLVEVLGIPPVLECRPPTDPTSEERLDKLLPFAWRSEPFAMLHLRPRNRYKEWTDIGWLSVARHLLGRECRVVIVGGSSEAEMRSAEELVEKEPDGVVSIVGSATLADAAVLLHRCRVYVGLDTAMTHLAAVCGAPTVALYGRVLPQYMPYHGGFADTPYDHVSPHRLVSRHVHVLLGRCDCAPGKAVCAANVTAPAACLQDLPADSVTAVLDEILDH